MHFYERRKQKFVYIYLFVLARRFYRFLKNFPNVGYDILERGYRYVESRTKKHHLREVLLFFSIRRKVLLKVIDCFCKLRVIILHRLKSVNTDLDALKVVVSTLRTKNVQTIRKNRR